MNKVRVQLLDEKTGAVIEEVDVLTSAGAVTFADGETFQQKLDAGKLTGPKGATGDRGPQGLKGDTGATGPQGIQGQKGDTGLQGAKGDKGDPGDSLKYGTSLSSSTNVRLFLKKM